jgi:uncharacterized coiled-coil protein SlyX
MVLPKIIELESELAEARHTIECQAVTMANLNMVLAERRARIATLEEMLLFMEQSAAKERTKDLMLRACAMNNCSAAIDLYDMLIEQQAGAAAALPMVVPR